MPNCYERGYARTLFTVPELLNLMLDDLDESV